VVAVIDVLLTSVTPVAASVKADCGPGQKPVPVIVTAVAPVDRPGVGSDRSQRRRRIGRRLGELG